MPYQVYTLTNAFQRAKNQVGSFVVSDKPSNWDEDEDGRWSPVAEFPVSQRNTEDEQRNRAYDYRDYMNSRVIIHPPIGT